MISTETIVAILSTSFATALLSKVLDRYAEHLKSQKEKKYSSIRLSVILETYGLACSNFISENLYHGQRYGFNEDSYKLTNGEWPKLEVFPSDINWKEIDPKLASRALSFNAEELMTEYLLDALADDEFGWDRLYEVHKIVGYNGYRAWVLANSLRTSVKLLKAENLHIDKHVEKHLHSFYEKSVNEANERQKWNTLPTA